MQVLSFILKEYAPYLAVLIIGILIGWRGCGDYQPVEIATIEKPIPKIEYVDRWKHDTTRFTRWITKHDTIIINDTTIDVRLDTLLKVDTLKIVETWLTEVVKYDSTLEFNDYNLRLQWNNYQNFTEDLTATLMPKDVANSNKLSILMFAKVGTRSNFKDEYYGNIGAGLLFEKKRFIFGADYGYSGQHNINGVVGYRLK